MMKLLFTLMLVSALIIPIPTQCQGSSTMVSGEVRDPSGAAVPKATVTLRSVASEFVRTQATDEEGLFSFPNLQQGGYEIDVTASGFKQFSQKGVLLRQNEAIRVPISLQVGDANQTVEVTAAASALNVETPEVKGTISRTEIEQLPLQVAGGQRSAATFVTLLPGVSPGSGQSDAFQARFNGGQRFSDEAILDGVTMQEGLLSQSGMVAIHNDFPIAPEAVDEISVLTSNYDVQYGSSSAAVIIASTKQGTNAFHGGAYEYNRNTVFNARPWNASTRPRVQQNDYGFYLGGPIKWRALWNDKFKTYFYGHHERFRSVGATTKTLLTVPTERMRSGDFSEWPNPIYDPLTTRSNPNYDPNTATGPNNLPYLRQQFMGCNGTQANVICGTDPRLQSSLAQNWLKLVPVPNRPGLIANYEPPIGLASSLFANTDQYDARGDAYIGERDHISGTYHYRGTLPFTQAVFPAPLDTNNTRIPNYSNIARGNWDHTFSPTKINNFNFGFLDLPTKIYNSSDCCIDQLPKIAGVYKNNHASAIRFATDYSGYSGNGDFFTTRPTWAFNDTFTWIKGRHQLKLGGEYRSVKYPTFTEANGSGTFNFSATTTGLRGLNSGNPIASFLLGTVESASAVFYTLPEWSPTGYSYGFFVADQWKATNRLNVTLGVRWDVFKPSMEAEDRTSFFDPFGANPGAGGRPGRLAFAGDNYGEASFGRRAPETTFYGAVGPRVGIAYSLNEKTVVRTGFGVFFMQNFYPGWNGGIATDGFNATASFASGLGGLEPAFLLQNGLPQDFQKPPFTTSTYLNGQNAPNYRPFDSNELPYSDQWNFTIERQITETFYFSVGYVGNKGTRLLSNINPINVLNPSYLSLRERLFDQFASGQTELNGVRIPYAGWREQLRGCPPSVAQALLPFPQYCGNIYGQNENVGNSTYHSLQIKVEQRFRRGLYFLTSYTWSKNLTSTDSAQSSTNPRLFSPFEQKRNKSYSDTDIPHVFTTSLTYQLPFGKGKRFGGGVNSFTNYLIGGWDINTIVRFNSGLPLGFRSNFCNVPSQFAAGCIPGTIPGQKVLAQDNGNYDPNLPRFNRAAFEDPSTFNFYWGQGSRFTNVRGFPYDNVDLALYKNVRVAELVNIQLRFEFFNVFNWHIFNGWNQDVSSPAFGNWTGGVSAPRNLQLGAKVTF